MNKISDMLFFPNKSILMFPALQADSLLPEPQGRLIQTLLGPNWVRNKGWKTFVKR